MYPNVQLGRVCGRVRSRSTGCCFSRFVRGSQSYNKKAEGLQKPTSSPKTGSVNPGAVLPGFKPPVMHQAIQGEYTQKNVSKLSILSPHHYPVRQATTRVTTEREGAAFRGKGLDSRDLQSLQPPWSDMTRRNSKVRVPHSAMGQNPVSPVNIPIPTKIGSKMGGAPTPKWDPIGVDPVLHKPKETFRAVSAFRIKAGDCRSCSNLEAPPPPLPPAPL